MHRDKKHWRTFEPDQREAFFARAVAKAASLGFRHLLFRGRYLCPRNGSIDIIHSTAGVSWRDICNAEGIDRDRDPLLALSLRTAQPIRWRDLAPNHPVLFARAASHGLATGISHTVQCRTGDWSTLCFVKDEGGPQAEADIDARTAECQLAACELHDIAYAMARGLAPGADARPKVALTRRSRECLELLARRRTPDQVASALEIRRRTVSHHLADARRKLGVRSSREAVEMAITLRLIAVG
jgi:LuxR family transcriptional activator of conjugal transfer of Ti plasmids